jgi:hypothetical protein
MKRSFRALTAALLIATPILSGCGDIQDPITPTPAPAVQPQNGLIGGLLGGVVGLISGVLNILTGPDANGAEKSAWIGSNGGTITTAAYTLVVPKGAVYESTRFTVKPTNTGTYSLDLTAERKSLLGTYDIGSKGFAKPVSLTISYAKANGVVDPRKLIIVYLRPDGKAEIQPSSINTSTKAVTSTLGHFSKYALVQN